MGVGVKVAAGGGATVANWPGLGVSVGVGFSSRLGAGLAGVGVKVAVVGGAGEVNWTGVGVGASPEYAVASATGRNANRAVASTALFNNDRMLCMGSFYLLVRLSAMVLCQWLLLPCGVCQISATWGTLRGPFDMLIGWQLRFANRSTECLSVVLILKLSMQG